MKRKGERHLLGKEDGTVAVVVALFMVILLGFAALVIDGGKIYLEKSMLQKALDSAVLAGAQGLRTSELEAISIAKTTSQKTNFPITESNLTVTTNSIKAVKEVQVEMTFAKVLGIQTAKVRAKATAIGGPIVKANGIVPIAVERSQIPHATDLKCKEKKHSPGNCGFLDFDTSGAKGLAEIIKSGSSVSFNDVYKTEPGTKNAKPIEEAFTHLIESDLDKPHCQSPETANDTCRRVMLLPIIDSWDGVNGKDEVKVVGLAAYWLISGPGKGDNGIKGEFMKLITSGEIGTGTGSEYNLFGVKLVE